MNLIQEFKEVEVLQKQVETLKSSISGVVNNISTLECNISKANKNITDHVYNAFMSKLTITKALDLCNLENVYLYTTLDKQYTFIYNKPTAPINDFNERIKCEFNYTEDFYTIQYRSKTFILFPYQKHKIKNYVSNGVYGESGGGVNTNISVENISLQGNCVTFDVKHTSHYYTISSTTKTISEYIIKDLQIDLND